MSAEAIVDALLRAAPITAVVGTSIALEQLPQGATYPALAYRVISTVPLERLCSPSGTSTSRVQVSPLADSVAKVRQLHALVRTALEGFAPRTVSGLRLISCRYEGKGPYSKDDFTGMWTQPMDYMLLHDSDSTE